MITLKEFKDKNPIENVLVMKFLKDILAEFIDYTLSIADDYGLDKNDLIEFQSKRLMLVSTLSDFTTYKPRGTEDED